VTCRRPRDDRGSALVEFTWLAVILLVPLVWIVVSVFEVQRGAFATSAAARAAGRAYALAPDDATGVDRANAAARQVLADQGAEGQQARVSVRCETPTPGSCHVGTSVITVVVSSSVALPMAPEVLGSRTASFALTATHRVPIGQYVESADRGQERSR
jgi:Flp pilus assembly protein TadG